MTKKYKLNISNEPHCRDLESLGSIFIPMIKDAVTTEDLVGIEIILHWKDIVGEKIYDFTLPTQTKFNPKTNKRTVFINVPVGGFALELQHKENYILNKINAYFGYNAVHKIAITQDMNMNPKYTAKNKLINQNLTEEEKKYLEDILKEIKDENLKEILTNIGKNIIANKKEQNSDN